MEDKTAQVRAVVAALRDAGANVTASVVAAQLGLTRSGLYRAVGGADTLQSLLREGQAGSVSLDRRVAAAVTRLLGARSLASIGVAEIAAEVGVTPVTLYRRFGNRDGMLRVVLEHSRNRTKARELDLVDTPDPEAELAGFCAESLRELIGVRGLIAGMVADDPESRDVMRGLHVPGQGTRASLAAAFTRAMAAGRWRDGDAASLADLLVRLLVGSALLLPELDPDADAHVPQEGAKIASLFMGAMRRAGPQGGDPRGEVA